MSTVNEASGCDGKPVLVVGGGSGIGRATAQLLAAVGARVAVADVDIERGPRGRGEVDALGVRRRAHRRRHRPGRRECRRCARRLGGLQPSSTSSASPRGPICWHGSTRCGSHDLRIEPAPPPPRRSGRGSPLDRRWRPVALALVDVDHRHLRRAQPRRLRRGEGGRDVALARTMASEWAPHGIRVNCVAPDVIATPRVSPVSPSAASPTSTRSCRRRRAPRPMGDARRDRRPTGVPVSDLSAS